MQLFEVFSVTIAYSNVMVTISTEQTRKRKCHFVRQLLLLKINPAVKVITFS